MNKHKTLRMPIEYFRKEQLNIMNNDRDIFKQMTENFKNVFII